MNHTGAQAGRHARCDLRALSCFLLALAPLIAGSSVRAADTQDDQGQFVLQIYQIDAEFDGQVTQDSGWGMIELLYQGSADLVYFNATIGGSWQIQNMPLLSPEGEGQPHLEYMAFDLGVPHGQDVPWIDWGACITVDPIAAPPQHQDVAQVFDADYAIDAGIDGEQLLVGNPGGQQGGRAQRGDAAQGDLLNQECGTDECVPAAVSNSLKRLNERFNLRIDMNLITIDALKAPLAWSPPVGGQQGTGGCPYDWPDKKKAYIEEKNLPIRTEQVSAGGSAREAKRAMAKLMRALRRDCMIEITVDGHTAQVTQIISIESTNKYTLMIQHDVLQNQVGGTIQQKVTYDATGGDITQGWLMDGRNVRHFVIQCPRGRGSRRR